MKIVDVSEFYAPRGGGVRTYVDAKLAAAAQHGHELVVVAPGPSDREEPRAGGRVHWIASPRLPLDARYHVLLRERAVHAVLDRERPDVVEGSSAWSGGIMCARWRGPALKSFVFHQDPVAVYPQTLLGNTLGASRVERMCGGFYRYLRALSRHYDVTISAGEWLAQRLLRHGVRAPRAVAFGIQKAVFSPTQADPELRQALLRACGMPGDAALLVAASRHHPEKRLCTLIDAVARLRGRRAVALVIYGDGPLRTLIARRARAVAGVRVMGRLEDRPALARVLASADALLHGSSAETFGLVVAEAITSGLPVIVPDQGGAAELSAPEYSECYRAGDSAACAAAILKLLARDRATMRVAAAQAGALRPSIDDHFTNLFATYSKLLASAA